MLPVYLYPQFGSVPVLVKKKKHLDLPAVCLLLLERRTLVKYLGWVLLHSFSPLTFCEAEEEKPISPEYTIEPEIATQSIPEPGADLCRPVVCRSSSFPRIDAFSSDPIRLFGCSSPIRRPSSSDSLVPFPSPSSHLDPPSLLVSSSSLDPPHY